MTGQFLNDDLPAGNIQSIGRGTKEGPVLRLEGGREVVFSDQVLFTQPQPVHLAVGDHIEKRSGSFVYIVNGRQLTDVHWILRNWLLPIRVFVPLAIYLALGTVYVLNYQRTPIGDGFRSGANSKPPRRLRTPTGNLLALVVTWLMLVAGMTVVLGCMAGCLIGIAKLLFP